MNTKRVIWLTAALIFILLAGGCANQQTVQQPPPFLVQPLVKNMWQQKADNLVFVLDASSSMSESYDGVEKFVIGRNFLANFNKTMPDLQINTALRSFGHSKAYSAESTVLTYGLSEYSRSGVANALAAIIPAGGPSPMEKSLKALVDDLKGSKGEIAMVVVSDGKDMDKSPLLAARELKAEYGDRLCIYTVLVGYDENGRALLSSLSQVSSCGMAVNAMDIDTGAEMADFVAAVLLKKAEGALPEMSKEGTWVFKDIKFQIDKAVLIPSSYKRLDEIVKILQTHPDIRVEIQGHTDSTASDAHNMDLSRRRALAVKKYLESKGVAASRMTTKGYGESRPIDTNATEKGRSNNRRVELKPVK